MKNISLFLVFILIQTNLVIAFKNEKNLTRALRNKREKPDKTGNKPAGGKSDGDENPANGKKSDSTLASTIEPTASNENEALDSNDPFEYLAKQPPKVELKTEKPPAANEREPWHEEMLVYSLLYGKKPENHYRTSVRPIDMANSLIKLTDEDFVDKNHFVEVQCRSYENFTHRKSKLGLPAEDWFQINDF